ncbi:carbamoyltransferase family protein [Magnetococcus sp. PR-3]|uniref:carbamoyltransferase family protein n=1 Tax=Magnetococcus sp. PR-3 TaxID=3120355 RepID=UPI002FCE0F19
MYILGLNGGLRHDASVCLMQDNEVIFMAEEERFIYKKHATSEVPTKATLAALNHAGITMDDVDHISLGWEITDDTLDIIEPLLSHRLLAPKSLPSISMVDHHMAHAASAYYSSGMDEATIVVIDGSGEHGQATSLYHGKGGQLKLLDALGHEHSLGHFYEAATRYLGMKSGNEGKTMGLASYGEVIDPIEPLKVLPSGYRVTLKNKYIEQNRDSSIVLSWFDWFQEQFGKRIIPDLWLERDTNQFYYENPYTQNHKNIAASVQHALQEAILSTCKMAIQATGCRNLVLTGGVALNCSANGKVMDSGIADELYLLPASSDAGTALGAAQLCYLHQSQATKPLQPIRSAALGTRYSNDEVLQAIKHFGLTAKRCDDIALEVAKKIGENKVVGWFQGAMEVGPRALGQRSIIANPSSKAMLDHVNVVKGREAWRPLAPSLQREHAGDYLENDMFEPFMLTARKVKEELRDQVSAITHVDHTCRPQLVDKQTHPRYWQLLEYVKQQTGHPMVMNTSFNLRGQTIVCTPRDAIQTFYASPIDCLAIEDYLLVK